MTCHPLPGRLLSAQFSPTVHCAPVKAGSLEARFGSEAAVADYKWPFSEGPPGTAYIRTTEAFLNPCTAAFCSLGYFLIRNTQHTVSFIFFISKRALKHEAIGKFHLGVFKLSFASNEGWGWFSIKVKGLESEVRFSWSVVCLKIERLCHSLPGNETASN